MMLLSLSATALLLGSAIYYSPHLWRYMRVHSWRKQITKTGSLILTYDDGPSETLTPRLLDVLRSYNARASFFAIGRNAAKHPTIADRIVGEGHDLACHSDQHLNAWKVTPWRSVADINAGYEALSSWMSPDGMFRPPYGKMTLPTYFAVRSRGAEPWWWTIDSGDTREQLGSPTEVAAAVEKANGGIVLLHDLARTKERDDYVTDTTVLLLETARRVSLRVKRLSEFAREIS
jgi:peptidoglycan/xylan/chitin deacetylase (PgdA/CDA1 family)